MLIKKKYQSLTSWDKTNHCEKARWRSTVFRLPEFFSTRKKLTFYSEIWPKTYANALWADTLQFYASFMDLKCILEELTASWRRKWVDGELTASSRTLLKNYNYRHVNLVYNKCDLVHSVSILAGTVLLHWFCAKVDILCHNFHIKQRVMKVKAGQVLRWWSDVPPPLKLIISKVDKNETV